MAASSFDWPMRLLSASRYRAMRALYDFCREVDDIADGPETATEKQAQLEQWAERIHNPQMLPIGLREAIEHYQLPTELFVEILNAMQMDAKGHMCWPDEKTLKHYCDGAAGAVGLLSIRIFGCSTASESFALTLGQILQRINILRDITEDARRGRVYLAREWLHGAPPISPEAIAAEPSQVMSCVQHLRADIDTRLTTLRVPQSDRRALLPARAMLGIYLVWYERLREGVHLTQRVNAPGRTARLLGMWRGVRYWA